MDSRPAGLGVSLAVHHPSDRSQTAASAPPAQGGFPGTGAGPRGPRVITNGPPTEEQEVLGKGSAPKGLAQHKCGLAARGGGTLGEDSAGCCSLPNSEEGPEPKQQGSLHTEQRARRQRELLAGVGGSLSTAPRPAASPFPAPLCTVRAAERGPRGLRSGKTRGGPGPSRGFESQGPYSCGRSFSRLLTKNGPGNKTSSLERNSRSNKLKFLRKSFISGKLQKGNLKVITLQVMGCLFFYSNTGTQA